MTKSCHEVVGWAWGIVKEQRSGKREAGSGKREAGFPRWRAGTWGIRKNRSIAAQRGGNH